MLRQIASVAAVLLALSPLALSPVKAVPLGISKDGVRQPGVMVEKVARVVRRGGAVVGPRGGVAVRRGGAVVGPRGGAAVRRTTVVRPGYRGGVRWARPGRYWWRPGGAVVAGAAIGFVTAATAVAWAGAAPAPNMCWYYTDPSRTRGFLDVCP